MKTYMGANQDWFDKFKDKMANLLRWETKGDIWIAYDKWVGKEILRWNSVKHIVITEQPASYLH